VVIKTLSYLLFAAALSSSGAQAGSILGSAADFAVLAGSTVTNTGASAITGDVGVSPGTAIVGFPSGIVVGTIHSNDTAASQAHTDLSMAYSFLSGLPSTTTLSNSDLGGLTLTQGVYKFDAAADLTGTLTLSGPGSFIFQIGTGLTVANNAAILTIAGADPNSIFFQIGSSLTIGTGAELEGNMLAAQSISLATGSSLLGRALAINAAVTLQDNAITAVDSAPEPGTVTLSGIALACGMGWLGLSTRRRRGCE
jgi:type VI secretion system secreted protein VgrG